MKCVYIRATGQADNLGDVTLRRALLSQMSDHAKLHVLTGSAQAFAKGLKLAAIHKTYTSERRWQAAFARDALLGRVALYVGKPGEIAGKLSGRERQLLAVAKLFGVPAVRSAVGLRSAGDFSDQHMKELRSYLRVGWRDSTSAARGAQLGIGYPVPDWAFAEGTGYSTLERKSLVLSFRFDRPQLSDQTITEICQFAAEHDLMLICICQVERDGPPMEDLAAKIGAKFIPWNPDMIKLEHDLRDQYRQSMIVISDRLHVLINSFTEGAAPFCLTSTTESKIERHFAVIGYHDITAVETITPISTLRESFARQIARSDERQIALQSARSALSAEAASLLKMVSQA